MMTDIKPQTSAFLKLGEYLKQVIKDEEFEQLTTKIAGENPWFTINNIKKSFLGLSHMLEEDKLNTWINHYAFNKKERKKVGIIMAGNIPLVGFHDLLCTVVSGHHAIIKTSRQDTVLIKHILNKLIAFEPALSTQMTLAERLNDIDAIIATGSDNSSRYFEYYFGKYPHIIRKNRGSMAIISGDEKEENLIKLGDDVFSYFGLGCRNVSSIFIPEDYDIHFLAEAWREHQEVINHHKYANNYDYQKSIFLINQEQHFDLGYVLLREHTDLLSPISVVHLHRYRQMKEVAQYINENRAKIQCIVASDVSIESSVDFGMAQQPELWDYADDVDTMDFLTSLD